MGTLTERFQALGWRVFRVPEAATMLLSGGHSFANLNRLQQYQFQAALLRLMLSLEEAFITLARSTHERCIVLCDRGTMDCRSYMPEEEWEQLVAELGTSTLALRDERYDCVVHMVTAADGADVFYTTEGHAARSESADYAKELDKKVKNNCTINYTYAHAVQWRCNDVETRRNLSEIVFAHRLFAIRGLCSARSFFSLDCRGRPSLLPSRVRTHITTRLTAQHGFAARGIAIATNNSRLTLSFCLIV